MFKRRNALKSIRKHQKAIKDDLSSDYTSIDTPKKLESGQFESWSFASCKSDDEHLYVKIDRNSDENTTDAWLSLYIPNYGSFELPRHPETRFIGPKSVQDGGYGPMVVSCNGTLSFTRIEPEYCWLIQYDGYLRVSRSEYADLPVDSLVRVIMKHRWKKMTDVHFSDEMDTPESFLDAGWESRESRVQSFGHMKGITAIQLKNGTLSLRHKMSGRGVKSHVTGLAVASTIVHAVLEYGECITVRVPETNADVATGFVTNQYGILLDKIHKSSPISVNVGKCTEIKVNDHHLITIEPISQLHLHDAMLMPAHVSLNGVCGHGFVEMMSANHASVCSDSVPSIVPLDHQLALDVGIVGGKGAQLAALHHLRQATSLFAVSHGVVITTHSHTSAMSDQLKVAIKGIMEYSSTEISDELDLLCKIARDAYEMPADLRDEIRAACQLFFKGDLVAIRSSAVAEDGTDASSAGQLETVLGVAADDIDAVTDAVLKCWASQFTPRAVIYRSGKQQESGMGVVIQKMVKSNVSGVIFTVNPVNNDVSEMMISSNYGLGETVVSGSVDVDTYVVGRDGSVKSVILGEKREKMITVDGHTETVLVSEEDRKIACLSTHISPLCIASVAVERHWGCPCDIEFGFDDDGIVLLQARPITSLSKERETLDKAYIDKWDLIHEFDTPVQSDNEWLTTSNISEMTPGAVTPLMFSMFGPGIDYGTGTNVWRTDLLPPRVTLDGRHIFTDYVAGHPFMNLTTSGKVFNFVAGTSIESLSFSILGRVDVRWTSENVIGKNGKPKGRWEVMRNTKKFYSWLFTAGPREIKELTEKMEKVKRLGEKNMCTADLYGVLCNEKQAYNHAWASHIASSSRSGMWAAVFMSMINPTMSEITSDHYADMAALMGRTGGEAHVESANVPQEMARLANLLKNGNSDFATMEPQQALQWLLNDSGDIAQVFAAFLARHGHRSIREAEFRTLSWSEDPTILIEVLQGISIAKHAPREIEAAHTSMPTLRSPVSSNVKRALKSMLSRARKGVGEREYSKSVAVRHQHMYKLAYRELAMKMTRDELLPDEDLIYFLTHREIGLVIHGDSAAATLIARARERRDIFPHQFDLSFDEFGPGMPIPLSEQSEDEVVGAQMKTVVSEDVISGCTVLRGLPMCLGSVEGKARICRCGDRCGDECGTNGSRSVSDAKAIEKGEILICSYTDVGWSPFFLMIGGLVTELGGLLSHGAVVAREVGIPCVVGCRDATTIIKTGDRVWIDAEKGVVELLDR